MKSMAIGDAAANLDALLNSAQQERVVLTRNGKPSAVVVGVESYDDEDLRLVGSADFWRMIESRRRSGASIPLAELKERLKRGPRKRSAKRVPSDQQKNRARPKKARS